MPRFFIEYPAGDEIVITGDDAHHISRSLRMRAGERLIVCDTAAIEYHCEITSLSEGVVYLRTLEKRRADTEPDIKVTLYQGYPKGDKLETVIEKAVELGVWQVVPVLTERSVARPDAKSAAKKQERWQRRALEAAKQCGRGCIPQVLPMMDFSALPQELKKHSLCIFFYELGGAPLDEIINDAVKNGTAGDIAVFVGPEGGIASSEAEALTSAGAVAATLGKRILRTETAPLAALTGIMLLTGNMR